MIKSSKIIVASHHEATLRNLKPPFLEVCVTYGEERPFGYTEYVSKKESNLKFIEAWSEIAILLDMCKFIGTSTIIGLQHYRRFFALTDRTSDSIFVIADLERNNFMEKELTEFSCVEDEVFIARKWYFDRNSRDQFLQWHPELEELLNFSLTKLDEELKPIFGEISSLDILLENSYLYPYNMFIGPTSFYKEWVQILGSVVEAIEIEASSSRIQLPDRSGGYIAERLFSVYVTLCRKALRWNFIEKSVVLFDKVNENTLIDALTQQRDELTQQRDELTQQRDELINSTIWRVTKPLRDSINFLKK